MSRSMIHRCRSHPRVEILEDRTVMSTVSPVSIDLGPGTPLATTKTETLPVSITLPSGGVTDEVDLMLLLDDTGSFAAFSSTIETIFSNLVTSLQTALPGVDFAFGVTRVADFGGPGDDFDGDNSGSRPFTLNQPLVTDATAAANGTTVDALISTALANHGKGTGGDTPEAYLEALDQIATGAGFDGNGDGNTTDSGAAGFGGLRPGQAAIAATFRHSQQTYSPHQARLVGSAGGLVPCTWCFLPAIRLRLRHSRRAVRFPRRSRGGGAPRCRPPHLRTPLDELATLAVRSRLRPAQTRPRSPRWGRPPCSRRSTP